MKRELYIFRFLAKTLMFPIDWLRWLLVIALVSASVLFVTGMPQIAFIVGASSLMLTLLFGVLLLPSQALSLISNKQLSLLASLKRRIYFFLILHSFLVAGLAAAFGYFSGKLYGSAFAVMFFMASVTICVVIFLGSITQYLQIFMGVLIFPLQFLFGPLMALNTYILAIACVAWWIIFYTWWMRWQPKKFYTSPLFLSPEKMALNSTDAFFGGWLAMPKLYRQKFTNISRVLLLGGVDSQKMQITAVLGVAVFFTICFAVQIISGSKPIEDIVALNGVMSLFFIFVMAISSPFSYCINLHKIWMLFPGGRAEQFRFIENNHFKGVIIYILAMLIFVAGVFFYLHLNLLLLVNIMLALAIAPWLVFYSQIFGYHKYGGFSRKGFYINALGFSLVGICAGICWIYISVHGTTPKILSYISLGNALLLIVTLLQRARMRNLWTRVNFVRVGIV